MTSYKPTNIPWLPEIPENWDIIRVKHILKEMDSRSVDGNEDLLSVSQYTGVTLRRDKLENDEDLLTNASTLVGYKRVEKSDLVINIMLAWNGSLGVSPYNGIASPAYGVYRFKGANVSGYYHYLLRTPMMQAYFKSVSTGVIDSRLRMYSDDFFRLYVPLPPLAEQQAIAAYLDEKTAQIAAFISGKQKLIALLKEQKAAIIQQALTPAFWKADFPETAWVKKKLPWLFRNIGSGTTPDSGNTEYYGGHHKWINTGDLNDGYLEDCEKTVSDAAIEQFSVLKKYPAGSLVIALYGATIGKTSITTFEACTNQACCVLAEYKESEVFLPYMFYWFLSIRADLIKMSVGGGQPNISQGIIRSLRCPLPSVGVQKIVVDYIRDEHQKLDALITRAEREIALVKELQQSIIAEAVTGKLQIPA